MACNFIFLAVVAFGSFMCFFVKRADAQQARADAVFATGIQAVHRSGQTFLTWFDAEADNVKAYRILRHTARITDDNLAETDVIAPAVDPASAVDYVSAAIYGDRRGFIVSDLGEPLRPNQGLYVHTSVREGPAFYAVIGVDEAGHRISDIVSGQNSLEEPVAEMPGQVRPVMIEQFHTDTGVAEVYTHWVDTRMHPRAGMAYRFAVTHSHAYRPEARHRLLVRLHGAGGYYGTMHIEGDDWIVLYPDMRTVTYHNEKDPAWDGNGSNFWYGLNSNFYDSENPLSGLNVNYGERRVLWTIDWVMAHYNIDPDRVHLDGGSMGGYGSLSLALRHPDLFASVAVWVPPVDFHRMSDYGNGIAVAHWGPREKNILTHEGIGIYDRADLVTFVRNHPEIDFPMIYVLHGKQDKLIGWKGPPLFYEAMQQTHHGMIAVWSQGGHAGPQGFRFGTPEVFGEINVRDLRRNQSYPAIAFASTNDDPGLTPETGDPNGQLNALFEWRDIVDRAYEYGITIAPLNGRLFEATADITPRRLQRFRVEPGEKYSYRNINLSSGQVVEKGTLKPDKHRLLTVKAFLVGTGGNRLMITRVVQ